MTDVVTTAAASTADEMTGLLALDAALERARAGAVTTSAPGAGSPSTGSPGTGSRSAPSPSPAAAGCPEEALAAARELLLVPGAVPSSPAGTARLTTTA